MKSVIDIIARDCLAEKLRKLNRVVTNVYDGALRPYGLKVSQLNLLVVVAKMGTAHPIDVCNYLHLDASTLSRNVERMRSQGWLETVTLADRRSQPFRLTEQGSQLLEQAAGAWRSAQDQVQSLLGDEFMQQLDRSLRNLPAK